MFFPLNAIPAAIAECVCVWGLPGTMWLIISADPTQLELQSLVGAPRRCSPPSLRLACHVTLDRQAGRLERKAVARWGVWVGGEASVQRRAGSVPLTSCWVQWPAEPASTCGCTTPMGPGAGHVRGGDRHTP